MARGRMERMREGGGVLFQRLESHHNDDCLTYKIIFYMLFWAKE